MIRVRFQHNDSRVQIQEFMFISNKSRWCRSRVRVFTLIHTQTIVSCWLARFLRLQARPIAIVEEVIQLIIPQWAK